MILRASSFSWLGPVFEKTNRIGLEGQAAVGDLNPFFQVRAAPHVHAEAEAVQQLGPQIPFFRVHGADQDEAAGMAEGDPLPLHVIDPQGGHIQQQIHQVIFQQVDFIHIENGLVGPGQQPRFKTAFSLGQGGFKIQAPPSVGLPRPPAGG